MNKTKNLNRSKDLKDAIFYACMVALPTLHFFVMYLGVNLNSILLAFKIYDRYPNQYHIDMWANFKRFFDAWSQTATFKTAFKNSFISSAWTLAIGVTLSLTFSIYIYHKKFAHNFFKVVLFVPTIISSIVIVKIFTHFADVVVPKVINDVFHLEGVNKMKGLLANWKTRWGTVLFFAIWAGFGSSILLYVGGMSSISDSVSEAAHLDGANIIQESWYVTLPLIYPTIVILVITQIAAIFTNQLNLYSFFADSADSDIITLGYWFYNEVKKASAGNMGEFTYLSAIGLVCTCICVPITLGIKALLNKLGPKFE